MDHDLDSVLGWRGRTVVDRNGDKVGKVGELYLDEDTDRPAYAGIKTGLFGRKESIIPLDGVQERDGDLVVPYDADHVRDAPSVAPDTALEPEEADRLAAHYDAGDRTEHVGEMTRTEEEVRFGKTPMQPKERVRIKKVLVEDEVQQTVPVRREEIRLETDPPPEGRIESVEDVDER
jgi:sporulation protein YlmC with PRC-barrel domain